MIPLRSTAIWGPPTSRKRSTSKRPRNTRKPLASTLISSSASRAVASPCNWLGPLIAPSMSTLWPRCMPVLATWIVVWSISENRWKTVIAESMMCTRTASLPLCAKTPALRPLWPPGPRSCRFLRISSPRSPEACGVFVETQLATSLILTLSRVAGHRVAHTQDVCVQVFQDDLLRLHSPLPRLPQRPDRYLPAPRLIPRQHLWSLRAAVSRQIVPRYAVLPDWDRCRVHPDVPDYQFYP